MLLPDGTYQRVHPTDGEPLRRSQQRFIELARKSAIVEPARQDDSDEYVVPERQPPAKTTDSTVQPALHGKPSLLS
jgi:hypothetical protein